MTSNPPPTGPRPEPPKTPPPMAPKRPDAPLPPAHPQAALPSATPPLALTEHGESLPAPAPNRERAKAAPAPTPPPAQARQRRRGFPLWAWITAAALIVLVAVFFLGQPQPDAAAGKKGGGRHGGGMNGPMPVVAAKVAQGDIGVYDTGLGSVTPLNTVTVRSRVDGELTKVFFTEGQTVRAGDPLVEIDPRPYQVALEQAQGQLARDQALLNNARIDLQRYATLLKQDSIPQQTFATQQATVAQDEGVVKSDQAAVDNAQLNLDYCHITSPITGAIGLRLVDIGNMVHASDTTGLLVITQLQPITVVFTIAEDDVPAVVKKLAAGIKLEVDAYDRALTAKLAVGSLLSLDNQIDPATGTLKIKAQFDNKDNALFPNQFVNARLLVETHAGAVLAPTTAIQRGPSNQYVYLVQTGVKTRAEAPPEARNFWNLWGLWSPAAKAKDEAGSGSGHTHQHGGNQSVTVRTVTVGVTSLDGGTTEITNGLAAGDVVVIDGVDKLQEGGAVTVQMQKQP